MDLHKHPWSKYKQVSTVANTASILDEVTNSAEIEQEAELFNINCDTSTCLNILGAQTQAGVATVANTASLLDNIENSAEVEQEAELFNINCDTSFARTSWSQTQVGVAQ